MGARANSLGSILFHRAVGQMLDLNVSDMKCLDLVMLERAASPSQLAALTGLSSGATTAMIDRLEKAGLVERHRHPKDRRGTVVALTPDATKRLPRLFASMAAAMETLVASYSTRELELLADFFNRAVLLWERERQKLQPRRYKNRTEPAGRVRRRLDDLWSNAFDLPPAPSPARRSPERRRRRTPGSR